MLVMSLECFYRALIRKNVFLGVVLGMAGGSFSASAATLAVPGDYETIAAAIAAADDEDEIVIAAGTYLVEKGAPLVVDKAIVLRGADRATVIVKGNFTAENLPNNVVAADTSYDCLLLRLNNAKAQVEAITFENGFANNTGNGFFEKGYGFCSGVEVLSGMITNCVVQKCIGDRYGASALALKGADARAMDCRILENTSRGFLGGFDGRSYLIREAGLFVNKGTVSHCEIAYNTGAGAVGAMILDGTIEHCHIHHNEGLPDISADSSQPGMEGSIAHGVGVTVCGGKVDDCIIENNIGSTGVGAYLQTASAQMTNCTIANNVSRGQVVAILHETNVNDPTWYPPAEMRLAVAGVVVKAGTLSGCTVTNNTALYWGSAQGVYLISGNVKGCTIQDNGERGGEHGGNVLVEGGTFAADNTVGYTAAEGDGPVEVAVEDGESIMDAIARVRCPDGARGRVVIKPQTNRPGLCGDSIWNIVVKKPVEIVAPDGGAVIDAEQTGVPFFIANKDALIKGLEITGGKYPGRSDNKIPFQHACGVLLAMGTMEDCEVHDCTRVSSPASLAMVMRHGVVRRCKIHSHLGSSGSGYDHVGLVGAVAMVGGLVADSVVSNGTTGCRCGGLYMNGTSPIVERTLVSDCSSTVPQNIYDCQQAGGVWIAAGELRSSVIAGNKCKISVSGKRETAGGVFVAGGRMVNCTVAGNIGNAAGKAAGVYVGSNGAMVNSIVYGNAGENDLDVKVQTATTKKVYNNLFPETDQVTTEGANNLTGADVDPGFRNSAAHDYRIRPSSVAVNAGVGEDWMVGALDFAGNVRIAGRAVDLGAYESVAKGLSIIVR